MSNIFSTTTADRANEASLFVATNPTRGTAIVTGNAFTAFSATAPFYVIKNNAPVNGGGRTWLHSINMNMVTVAGTVASVQSAIVIDTGDRTPTAGSVLITPVNTVPGGKASTTQVWVGSGANLTVPAESSARTIARRQIRGGLNVVVDEYELKFGSDGSAYKTANAAVGTFSSQLPALCLLPQQFALIHFWWPSAAAATMSYEFDMVLSER